MCIFRLYKEIIGNERNSRAYKEERSKDTAIVLNIMQICLKFQFLECCPY